MIVALAGGVGGAKLALGLSRVLPPSRLTIAVNTGDDFEHLGFHISPDIDTVIYTLSGIANPELGWGIAGETWGFMDALERLGGETWFRLGDRDLATHVERTRRLAAGETLSSVTRRLATRLGVAHPIVPMSDDAVRTVVISGDERLAFQDYFVRLRCEPRLDRLVFEGAAQARLAPALAQALRDPALSGIVLCPSNPFLSIGPMLAIPGLRERLTSRSVLAVAVSPIIAGEAVKGPAAKIFAELGQEVSPVSVARCYEGLVDVLLIDEADAALAPRIERHGMRAAPAPILMRSLEHREALAATCLAVLGSS